MAGSTEQCEVCKIAIAELKTITQNKDKQVELGVICIASSDFTFY
jgi:hypothetical protein